MEQVMMEQVLMIQKGTDKAGHRTCTDVAGGDEVGNGGAGNAAGDAGPADDEVGDDAADD